jgi:carboxypeptidase Q
MRPVAAFVRAAAVCVAVSCAVFAQVPAELVEKIRAEGSPEKSRVMDHLHHLCINIGPRLTGSQNLIEAAKWAEATFKGYGLEAKLDKWTDVEVGFDRGTHSGFMFWSDPTPPEEQSGGPGPRRGGGQNGRRLTFNTGSWTPGTKGVTGGPAVVVPKEEELETIADRAKGAWLVRVTGSATGKKLEEFALEKGAHGVVSNGGELLITAGNLRTKWDALPKLVRVALFDGDFKFLKEQLDAGKDVRLQFDVQNHFRQGPVPAHNVLAEIKGTEKPDELVIVGGHLDSWDGAMGTTDNGTGSATTIEAARILAAVGAKPKRTIRFMLWSGEEQGLLGSRDYIKRHPEENDRISAVLVHDGGTNYVSGIAATKAMKADFDAVFAPVFKLSGDMPFAINDVARLPSGIGSDHDSYVQVGVPGFFWNQAGRANYTYTHHTQHDVLSAAIPEYQRHTSVVVALGALGIANLPKMLDRTTEAAADAPNPMTARRRLGVQLDEQMTITEVTDGGRAKTAGLREGDRILKIDGRPVADRREMSTELNAGEPKKQVTVKRGAEEVTVAVEFPR